MAKAEINGLSLHYQQLGEGPPVVMIHGLFSSLAFWYFNVMPEMAARWRVTAYDLRGHGYSTVARSGYTSSSMAEDLSGLLDCLGIAGAHLVGHSFGGAVALQYAALHPERVYSLTLADAWVPCLQPELTGVDPSHWQEVTARLAREGTVVPEDLPRVAYGSFEEKARLPEWTAQGVGQSWIEGALLNQWSGDARVSRRWLELMRTTSAAEEMCSAAGLTVERIRLIETPALAIFGQYSGCLRTLDGLEENLRSCTKVLVPGVGHLHPLLRPDLFVRHLEAFLLAPARSGR